MTVQVIGRERIVSDATAHQARNVGNDRWEVSWLPGRKFTCEQATAAIRAAEEAAAATASIGGYAQDLGLTSLEAIGLASRRCTWPPAVSSTSRRRLFGRCGGVS